MNESNDTRFPVLPDTDEHTVLSFLVRNGGERFAPHKIVEQTSVSELNISAILENLFEYQLICCSEDTYYVNPEGRMELKHRLESIDAAVRIHDTAPENDSYAEDGWEDQLGSIQ
ncbi:MarR family transcriptional regulator [Halorubrum ezzemoulense]|uniref:MarR family transcriptional regulator n=1 Tax=Halorubrum ezzemoulense TaxID=337243 RepID=UPI0023312777|nr:MarR family transcriptional regulator [Halorubrum ezzemoulense]MDB2274331.1 MarR family transcriptional regulator [Halorubrum ezzemoulense]